MASISTTMYFSANGGASWSSVGEDNAKYTGKKGASDQVCYVFMYSPEVGRKLSRITFTCKMMGVTGYNMSGPWEAELYENSVPDNNAIATASVSKSINASNYTDITFDLNIDEALTIDQDTQLCIGVYAPSKATAWTGTVETEETAASFNVVYTYGGKEITDTKSPGEHLTLRGASFYRNGYTQIGWSNTEDGDITHAFGERYTTDAPLTLYPVWGIAPKAVLWLLLSRIRREINGN